MQFFNQLVIVNVGDVIFGDEHCTHHPVGTTGDIQTVLRCRLILTATNPHPAEWDLDNKGMGHMAQLVICLS